MQNGLLDDYCLPQKVFWAGNIANSTTPVNTVSPANFERRLRTGLEGILPQHEDWK